MDSTPTWLDSAREVTASVFASLAGILPSLLLALAVLVVGWLLARVGRKLVGRLTQSANRLLDRLFQRGQLSGARLSTAASRTLGELVFWMILVIAVLLAASTAGFGKIMPWLSQLVSHLPHLIAGFAIILVGFIISLLVRERSIVSARNADIASGETIGRLAQLGVLSITLIFGLDQMGVDVTILIVLTATALAGLLAGLLVAFGLGARDHVSNLIAARNARNALSAGLHIRIGDLEGHILDITPTQITLDTPDGKLLVPAQLAEREPILIITETPKGEADHG